MASIMEAKRRLAQKQALEKEKQNTDIRDTVTDMVSVTEAKENNKQETVIAINGANDSGLSELQDALAEKEALLRQKEKETDLLKMSLENKAKSTEESYRKQLAMRESSIQKLESELEHYKELANARSTDDYFSKEDDYGRQFCFHGDDVSFGPNWSDPTKTASSTRLYISNRGTSDLFDSMMTRYAGRQVVVDIRNRIKVWIKGDNLFLSNKNKLYYLVSMMIVYQHDPDELVKYALLWLYAAHPEVRVTPSQLRQFAQGKDESFDFYVMALAYKDWMDERAKESIGKSDLLVTLYDLRDGIKENNAMISMTNRDVRATEMLTALSVGRDLGLNHLPLQSNVSPEVIKEHLMERIPNTETEVTKDIIKHARELSEQVDRREMKARKGFK